MSFGSTLSSANIDSVMIKNLIIANNAANPTYQVDVTADVIQIGNIVATSYSKTPDITVSGANGLDTGSEAASTWYYVWAIAKADGTVASLLSASSTDPSMPSGYTMKRRVGAVRNDASSNFLRFVQEGNKVDYIETSGYSILSDGTATSYTTVSAAGFVPPTSRRVNLRHWILIQSVSAGVVFNSQLRKTGSGATEQVRLQARTQVANQAFIVERMDHVDIDASQQLDYQITPPGNTAKLVTLFVQGYYDRI